MAPKFIYSAIVGTILLAALFLRIWDPAPVAQLRNIVFDSYQKLSPRQYDPRLPVRIIDIDEESLKKIGQWPWARTVLAEIVEKLKENGAAAIGFDLILSESDRQSPEQLIRFWPNSDNFAKLKDELANLPSNDRKFSKTLEGAPAALGFVAINKENEILPLTKFGFAFAGDDPKAFVPAYLGASSSLPILQKAAKGSGSLNWIPEHDQIIRRIPLLVQISGQIYPALSLEALRIAQQATTYIVKSSGASGEHAFGQQTGINTIKVGALTIPTDANGQLWLKLTKSDPQRFISAWRLRSGEVPREEIEGRIILIGTSAAGLFDLRTTPLDASTPGVEIHAQAIEQILEGAYLRRPDFALGAELVFLAMLGLLVSILVFVLGATWSALVGAGAIAAVIYATWLAFDRLGWLVDPIYPTIAVIAIFLAGTVYVILRTETERNQVRSAFSHYMAPTLVEELASNPEKLRLGGEEKELTLLFCDVRGFTTISEGMNAERLTRFLNRLLTPLTDVIMEERGTIDKYMGDAIMAFWNAPLDDPSHQLNACKAALRLQLAVDALNAEWRGNVEKKGEAYIPLRIGVGINTGPCCVGNLGSERRFDYSVIGDNVNIASRLEGLTKIYGVNIIIGESTYSKAPSFASIELDLISVKGRREASRIFWLFGDESKAHEKDFLEYRNVHNQMLESYRSQRWDDAEALIRKCQTMGGEKCKVLYSLYKKRINSFRDNPPAEGWDGRTVAATK